MTPTIDSTHHTRPAVWRIARHTALAISTTLVLTACGDGQRSATSADGKTAASATKGSAAEGEDSTLVKVRPDMAGRFKAEAIQMHDLAEVQEVSGRIEANEQRLARIGAAVTGRVTAVLMDVGDRVALGQPMAHVSSPELTQAQLAYLRAVSGRELAERAEDRAQQLLKADVIGSAELQRRQSELAIATAELKAAADQLEIMGIPPESITQLRQKGTLHPHLVVSSTLAGTVIERKVSQGQVATPGDPLFTVADLSRVWVVGGLPEQKARAVVVGQRVQIEVPALGQQRWSGRIIFVGDTVNPDTRTVTIRTEVENTGRTLKPQMLATMRIAAASERTLAVPTGAVVREKDRDHVYVEEQPGQFRLVPVQLAPAISGLRPVLDGLKEGARVVVEGAFHLNNERKRAELE
jgi:cobalt-zinc-cadmium efflux system membrane fusion protein